MHYKVGDKKFKNVMLAFDESKQTGKELEFDYYDDIIQNMDWGTNYLEKTSWQEVCRQRALELRQKYERVRIWFSGGRDSFIVLKTFVENNIWFDELVIMEHPHRRSEAPMTLEWLKKRWRNIPCGKITTWRYGVSEYYQKYRANWAEDERLCRILPVFAPLDFQRYVLNKYHSDNTAEVLGIDKPRLFIGDGVWHTYMVDTTVDFVFATVDLEPFFISRTVPIFEYQTQHCMDWVERNLEVPDAEYFNRTFFAPFKLPSGLVNPYWDSMCKACLREEYVHPISGFHMGKGPTETRRVDSGFYPELEQELKNHHTDLHTDWLNGVNLGFAYLEDFYQNQDVLNAHKSIMSKPVRIRQFCSPSALES